MCTHTGPYERLNCGSQDSDSAGMDLAAHLTGLAARNDTGRVEVTGAAGTAHLVVHDARICSVQISTARPTLAKRLVSTGHLTLVGFGAAVRTQQQHPQVGLGEALVRMGLITRADLESAHHEQICDDVATVLAWPDPEVIFHPVTTGTTPPPGIPVDEVLSAATARGRQWQQLEASIGGLLAVPAPADGAPTGQPLSLAPADWAVLCRVDGQRTLAAIAEQTGLTRLEVGEVLQELVAAGLLSVTPPAERPEPLARVIHLAEPPPAPEPEPQPPAPTPAPDPEPPAREPEPPAPEAFADPADLLRELSQLARGPDPSTNPRSSR